MLLTCIVPKRNFGSGSEGLVMGSEGLVMGSGGAPRALVDFFSAAALGALKPRCLDLHTFPFLEQRELLS